MVNYRTPLISVLSQINPVQVVTARFFMIHFKVVSPRTVRHLK
jgi:hypothetical protein